MEKKIILLLSVILIIATVGVACKKTQSINAAGTFSGYAVGSVNDAKTGKSVATVWKDGVRSSLTNGAVGAEANSVFVLGSDVYIAGYIGNPPVVWKNGIASELTSPSGQGNAFSIYVVGDDVYVAGIVINATNKSVATVWKNGVPTYLSDGSTDAMAYGVNVLAGDVYVAGCIGNPSNNHVAVVWKNGVLDSLSTTGSFSAMAYSVYASSSTVYVVGYQGLPAALWENKKLTTLTKSTTDAIAFSLFVVEPNDVYVGGYSTKILAPYAVATVWKNGTPQYLTDGSTDAQVSSVYVSGGTVYAAGYVKKAGARTIATLWKNNTRIDLTDGSTDAEVKSIVIK